MLLLVSCFYSCKNKNSALEAALIAAAENRAELEKVLLQYSKYPADSLKYKAACFLIENMPYYYYYEGELLDNYLNYYKALNENKRKTPSYLLDSINSIYGNFSINALTIKYDILEIDSAYLYDNIEHSFKVWQEQPWGKNVSFEEFCETILPYRLGNEKLVRWKEAFYEKYSPLLNELKKLDDIDDPLTAARLLTDSLRTRDARFTMMAPPNMPNIGPFAGQYMSGSCENVTHFTVYACRSLGIPCSIDFIPLKGNVNYGHLWVSYFDKNKKLYMQDFLEEIENDSTNRIIKDTKKLKIYRNTFSVNRTMVNQMNRLEKNIYPFFKEPLFKDVTDYYADCFAESITIPESKLYNTKTNVNIAYLCLINRQEWIPVAWTKFNRKQLSFHDINKGNLVRIATYENNKLVFQSPPFYIDCENELRFLEPSDEGYGVTLFSKTSVEGERWLGKRLINGVFEGSDTPDFKTKDTLYHIKGLPYRLMTHVTIIPKKKYRYVRYYGAVGSHCNIAEVVFYENSGDVVPLSGEIIGTPGCWKNHGLHEYTNVFDGSTETSFDYKYSSGGWAGLDLGTPKYISEIVYTPRNRDNYIRPQDVYEFFYLDNDWVSLGITKASSDSLFYPDIPQNTLLYLKNHTRGVEERVFTYEDDKQVWW